MPTLFIDNGGDSLRALFSRSAPPLKRTAPPKQNGAAKTAAASAAAPASQNPPCADVVTITAPNALGITSDAAGSGGGSQHVLGAALLALPHYHQLVLRRPVEKGFIVDAALQALLWSQCLLEPLGIVSEREVDLVLTCPLACPHDAAAAVEQLAFEAFRFRSVTFVTPSLLAMVGSDVQRAAAHRSGADELAGIPAAPAGAKKRAREADAAVSPFATRPPLTGIVVDCGFSGTSVTPFLGGRSVPWNAMRIDVGGKVLTNHLKELVSFSQVNVTEDTWLCNVIKERCCFVHSGVHAGAAGDSSSCEENTPSPGRESEGDGILLARSSADGPVVAHCAKTSSIAGALDVYRRWGAMAPMEKRRVIANQRRTVKAMIKHVRQQEREKERAAAKEKDKDNKGQKAEADNNQKDSAAKVKAREEAALALAEASAAHWYPPPAVSYVLPSSPQTQPLGYVVADVAADGQEDWQYVRLGHEAFIVGEALLHPRLLGLQQVGVAEALRTALWWDPRRAGTPLFGAPPAVQQSLLRNTVLCGGTGVGMRGFADRLSAELRPALESDVNGENGFLSLCSNAFVVPAGADGARAAAGDSRGVKGRRRVEGAVTATSIGDASAGSPSTNPSFVVTGALALVFGWHSAEVAEMLAVLGLAGAATPLDALCDAEATVMSAKLTRDSVRSALGVIR